MLTECGKAIGLYKRYFGASLSEGGNLLFTNNHAGSAVYKDYSLCTLSLAKLYIVEVCITLQEIHTINIVNPTIGH